MIQSGCVDYLPCHDMRREGHLAETGFRWLSKTIAFMIGQSPESIRAASSTWAARFTTRTGGFGISVRNPLGWPCTPMSQARTESVLAQLEALPELGRWAEVAEVGSGASEARPKCDAPMAAARGPSMLSAVVNLDTCDRSLAEVCSSRGICGAGGV
jgi:hypothetical protein